jgi:RNA recognition motif-containing protein
LKIDLFTQGRLKGQAFITFPCVEMATQALEEVHGFVLKDKPLVIVCNINNEFLGFITQTMSICIDPKFKTGIRKEKRQRQLIGFFDIFSVQIKAGKSFTYLFKPLLEFFKFRPIKFGQQNSLLQVFIESKDATFSIRSSATFL